MKMVLIFGLHKTQNKPSVFRRILGFLEVSAPWRDKSVRIKLAVTLKIEQCISPKRGGGEKKLVPHSVRN